jgi:hypothetical protein
VSPEVSRETYKEPVKLSSTFASGLYSSIHFCFAAELGANAVHNKLSDKGSTEETGVDVSLGHYHPACSADFAALAAEGIGLTI